MKFRPFPAAAAAFVVLAFSVPAALAQNGKKELVQKIVALQQPAIETMARQMVEMPAAQLLQQAGAALQRLPADKREAVGREIQADARRYVDDTLPTVRERAVKLAPLTIGPILEEKMTEDELAQVLKVMEAMEAPVFRKYNALGGDLQRALGERLVAETKGTVEPRMRSLQDSVAKRLGVAPKPAGAASGAAAGDGKKK